LKEKVWTVPASRMKAGREHRVPLSDRAVKIVTKLGGRFALSSMAMAMLLRRMEVDATVHGFRSSFRDWAGNETHFPREVCEAALAHVIENKAEAAYRRSDALDKRRELMAAWSEFCGV
jgi:integrase